MIPLRLSGDDFAVYQQLSEDDKRDAEKIKTALLQAFADDAFVAYSIFVRRKLNVNESVDVFMADLKRLSALFGGMSDQGLACAFVAGLPETARQALRAGCRVESLQLSQLLARARAVLTDANDYGAAAVMTQHPPAAAGTMRAGDGVRRKPTGRRCFVCDGANHLARDCLLRKSAPQKRDGLKCFRCGGAHLARVCSENWIGEVGSAPASSPDDH